MNRRRNKRRSSTRTPAAARRDGEKRSAFNALLKYRQTTKHGSKHAVPVTANTAVCISAVFASVRILSGLLSSLPIKVYERRDGGQDREAVLHPVSQLLKVEPNPDYTPAILKEAIGRDYWLFGNSYLEQSIDAATGETYALTPHLAQNVTPFRNTDGRIWYEIRDNDGKRVVDRSMMVHSPALGFDGIGGQSVITLAAQSMGIALSGDALAAQFNHSAAKPFLIVETPDYLDDEPHTRLTRDINQEWRGDDAFGSMLLEGGATAKTLSIPFKDAQFLESRKFQGEEIAARWFGLPPHLAGYLDRAHFNNVEEQDRALLIFTLQPALIRIEEEINRKLFRRSDRGRLYVKFTVDALLRPQQKERYEAHKSALMAGWKTVNEIRELEQLEPVAGGDVLARPASIFGNDPTVAATEPTDPPPSPPPPPGDAGESSRSWRDTSRDLAAGILDGLQTAEIHHLERFAKHRDAARVREWYEQHERRAVDKLAPLGPAVAQLLDHYRGHRNAILTALQQPNTAAALEQVAAGWNDEPAALAAALIAH